MIIWPDGGTEDRLYRMAYKARENAQVCEEDALANPFSEQARRQMANARKWLALGEYISLAASQYEYWMED